MSVWQRYRPTLRERNFIERIKTPVFLEAVLPTEIMQESQFQIRRERSTSASENISFPQKQTHPFSHHQHQYYQISETTPAEFFLHCNQQPTSCSSTQCFSQTSFKFRSQFQLLPQIRSLITLRVKISIIAQIAISQITSSVCRTKNGTLRDWTC